MGKHGSQFAMSVGRPSDRELFNRRADKLRLDLNAVVDLAGITATNERNCPA
jgi:hypothetical protein